MISNELERMAKKVKIERFYSIHTSESFFELGVITFSAIESARYISNVSF